MAEVEVAVIGEVEGRSLVGGGGVVEVQGVVFGEGVDDRYGQVAGVAFLAIGAEVSQRQGFAGGGSAGHGLPDVLVETDVAAVQRVGAVVGGELIRFAIEREPAPGNAVAIAPNQRPEVGIGFAEGGALVVAHILETQHHIAELAISVRHPQAGERAAVAADGGRGPVGVAEGEKLNCSSGHG